MKPFTHFVAAFRLSTVTDQSFPWVPVDHQSRRFNSTHASPSQAWWSVYVCHVSALQLLHKYITKLLHGVPCVCVCVCCIQSLHKNAMRDKKCCDQLSSSATQIPLAGQTAFHCVSVSVQVSTNESSQLGCCRLCTSSQFSKRSCTFYQQNASHTHTTNQGAWFKPHACD